MTRRTTRLTGVGVGPGDPELLTLKAARVLREADVVLVPVIAPDEPGRAEAVVAGHTDRIRRVVFSLDPGMRDRAWEDAAATVIGLFDGGAGHVAFATIGDPNLYSTFTYLARSLRARRPDAEIDTVPGITAMQDLAARSGTVLAEGAAALHLVPVLGDAGRLRAALAAEVTVVAYKFGRAAPEVLRAVKEAGRLDEAVYGARLGLPDQDVRPAREIGGSRTPYLSTLIVGGGTL